jgi:F0F1-type ATP synthase delta subunit
MNKKVRKLVELSFENGKIDNKVAEYILTNLSKKELKDFLKILKSKVEANRVMISSASILNSSEKITMSRLFPDYSVEFEENKQIGGGIKVTIGDTIIDLSVKNYIDTIILNIK